jgi:hypothetical protein
MKNKAIFCVLILLAVSPAIFAQSLMLGGSVSYTSTDTTPLNGTTTTTSTLTLSPYVGYQLSDNLDVGVSVIFGTTDNGTTSTTTFGLGPEVHYALLSWGSLRLLAGGRILYTSTSSETQGGGETTRKTLIIEAFPMALYDLNNRFSVFLELGSIGYKRIWSDPAGSETSTFGINVRTRDELNPNSSFSAQEWLKLGFLVWI